MTENAAQRRGGFYAGAAQDQACDRRILHCMEVNDRRAQRIIHFGISGKFAIRDRGGIDGQIRDCDAADIPGDDRGPVARMSQNRDIAPPPSQRHAVAQDQRRGHVQPIRRHRHDIARRCRRQRGHKLLECRGRIVGHGPVPIGAVIILISIEGPR